MLRTPETPEGARALQRKMQDPLQRTQDPASSSSKLWLLRVCARPPTKRNDGLPAQESPGILKDFPGVR